MNASRATGTAVATRIALATAALVATACGAPPGGDVADDLVRLERARAGLERRAEFAKPPGTAFVLLDLGGATVRQMHGAAVLREYPVQGVEIGRSSLAFVRGDAVAPAPGSLYEDGVLDPPRPDPRVEIIPPTQDDPGVPLGVPLPPEEAVPGPGRFYVRFPAGLTVEVVAAREGTEDAPEVAGAGALDRVRWKLRDALDAMPWRDRRRIRLVMPAAEAGALYRSFTPSTPWVVQ